MYWEVDYFLRPYGLHLLPFMFCILQNRLYKTIQCIFEVTDSLIRLSMLHSFSDTMFDVLLQNGFSNLIKCSANCGNLRQHVIAFTALFPQSLEAISMSRDACKPFSDILA